MPDPSLLIMTLFGLAAGTAILARPEWVSRRTGNGFWTRSPLRSGIFRYVGGLGFLAMGAIGLLDLLSPSISILPGA